MQRIKMAGWLFGVVFGLGIASGVAAQTSGTAGGASPASEAQQKTSGGQLPGDKSQSRPFISSGLNSEALAAQRPDQTVWLDTGGNGRVLGLLEREAVATAKGAVLILADEGQGADAELVGALRQPLAEAGWATMTLGLELPPYPVVRARRQPTASGAQAQSEEIPEAGSEAESPESPPESGSVMIDMIDKVDLDQLQQDYREKVTGQVGAAVSHLRGQGYRRVALVGVGRGAAPVTWLATNGIGKGEGEPQALVWVAPTLGNADLENLGEVRASDLRILDLLSGRAPEGEANTRQAMLKRAGFRGYNRQLVAIAPRPVALDARQVANRIAAWLQRQFFPEP